MPVFHSAENAHVHYIQPRSGKHTGLYLWPPFTCVPWRLKVTMKGVYQLPHATTTVASPCQTLRELLAWRRRVNAYSWPNPSIIGTMHEQCAEGLHFHDLPDRTPMECFVKICFREVSSFQVLYHCRVNSMISDIKGEGYSVQKNVTLLCKHSVHLYKGPLL